MSWRIDLTGKRIGKWKVISQAKSIGRRARWICKCDCGKKKTIWACNLLRKLSKSCGCTRSLPGKNNANWKGYGNIGAGKYGEIRSGASKRNIEFAVSIKYIWMLFVNQKQLCALSHLPLEMKSTASLDRIDNARGYIKGNVQWVHKDINFMKQDLSQEEFIEYCQLISQTHEPKNKNR